jgi:tetratricopeptide (TPR) repeat protein
MSSLRITGVEAALLGFVAVGLMSVVLLSRFIDQHRPVTDPAVAEESLYLNGNTVRRLSLGFNGLAADWYWMRSLQYVGGKVINTPNISLDNLGALNLKLLAPLLDSATTLDPHFLEPYQYAAIVLPAVNIDEAIRITTKGIEANPSEWRLYQHLGYIYWQKGDYQTASEVYGRGAQNPQAPAWMMAMKAKMAAEGGSRSTAREIYTRMLEQASDPDVQKMARAHLLQLASLDQRDLITRVLNDYKQKMSACPSNWQVIAPTLNALKVSLDRTGTPLDPAGYPYLLKTDSCSVELNPNSDIPPF